MKSLRTMVGQFFLTGMGDSFDGESGKADSRKVEIREGERRKADTRHRNGMEKIPDALRAQAEGWAELWGLPGLPDSVTLEFSRRLRSSLGNCRPRQSLIRLAAHLENGNEDLLEEVLCHELAHVAVYRLYGRSVRPHGREWKGLISAAGFEPRVRFQPGEGRFPPRP